MWEQIRSNKRRSVVLVLAMAFLLIALGFVIGEAVQPGAGVVGVGVATLVWGITGLVSYFQGGRILMAVSGARRIRKEDHPKLFNVVEEMVIASGMKKMPEVYIIDSPALNAFATGRDPDHAAVAVTAGLLGRLNRDQLQGVIAHELSHVVNRDILFMTLLGVMLGSIVMISEIFLRGMFYGGRSRRSRSSSRGGGQGQAIMVILALVLAVLAPLIAHIIYFAASRRREYLADANGAVLTRYPEGLASALEAISQDHGVRLEAANRATAPMFIVNPLQRRSLTSVGLFSTHPPTEERIRILRSMGGVSASFKAYQDAWKTVSGRGAGRLPQTVLGLAGQPVRPASEEPAVADARPEGATARPRAPMREAMDAVRKAHDYRFVDCTCGLRIKIPPNYTRSHVVCPRCRRSVESGAGGPRT